MEELQSWPPSSGDRSAQTAEELRAMREQADQTLGLHNRHLADIEAEINRRIRQIAEELAQDRAGEAEGAQEQLAELQRHQNALAEVENELHTVREQLTTQTAEQEAQLRVQADEIAELQRHQNTLAEVENELHTVREQLTTQTAEQESQLRVQADEIAELHKQREQGCAERDQLAQDIEAARQALDELKSQPCDACAQAREELTAAEQRIAELENNDELQQLLEQTQRKFDLALVDVNKLKHENTELHEELVRRPEANDQESPELVSLRAERDALAARVDELEHAPAQVDDAEGQQEVADLQRRFEMAVDDVRQLKQENAQLLEQVGKAQATAVPAAPMGGAMDWQAQKARLLAELNAEDDGTSTAERREERSTIQGTITITDRVISEKDKQLDELRAQLEAAQTESSPDQAKQALQEEILDQDELIQAERERLEKMQQELKEKLREAELEISVQRAKLARQQASVDEKLAQLPSADIESKPREESDQSQPRRRWLSALGLRDEKEED